MKSLAHLSRKQAKRIAKDLKHLAADKLPWKIAIVVDSTIQKRSTRHTDNAQRFNHGKGFVIGHQWTNSIMLLNDTVVPLPPIPFHTRNYCQKHALEYTTEHDLVAAYIKDLQLEDYIGPYRDQEVVVLADSGYDNKKIQNAVAQRKWNFIISLGKTRSVKSEKTYADTPESKGWITVADLFRNHRRLKWQTIRIAANSSKRKRIDFRARQLVGYLRSVGMVKLVCSEFKKRPDGRRKYLACNDLNATLRHIVMGYRMRWRIEIFHKEVKMHLGFEDVSTRWFQSVTAHVHWVYCAYILLHAPPPGISDQAQSLVERQRKIRQIIDSR
ncbi:MAG: transposase, partial [bacterium]